MQSQSHTHAQQQQGNDTDEHELLHWLTATRLW
jgi:hypothetical protein